MQLVSSSFEKISKVSSLFIEFLQDMAVFIRYSGISPLQNKQRKLYYKLLIEAHTLEKGLSLAAPRPLFGRQKIEFLIKSLDRYDPSLSLMPVEMILGAFNSYIKFHRDLGVSDPMLDRMESWAELKQKTTSASPSGGLRMFRVPYEGISTMTPSSFLLSRFSNRRFSPDRLPHEVVTAIVGNARFAPSQCNRQSTHAHFYQDQEKIRALLELQGGSAGFSQDITNLFVITSELSAWGGAQQRNQPFVDGALFCMSLIYFMHASGVATCPLNLAITNSRERKIKSEAGIPMDQRVIMMIAVGYPVSAEIVSAAASPRRDTAEILHFHNQ